MLNGQTPFHARNRAEFEGKVAASNYNLKEDTKENLTLEAILFLSQCLQHNENERKEVTDLMQHPYITKEFKDQQKLSEQHLGMIFNSGSIQNSMSTTGKKRSRST
jgi:serine/threonine protein kinase